MATPTEKARKEYQEFEEKVRRTVFIDNLSPQVTSAVLKTALGQFGNVLSVEFIPNLVFPYSIPQCVLVEMENPKQARSIINEMSNYPFMMSGMPRPVRALAAKAEMFGDRPAPPNRKIQIRWVDPSDPDFEVAKKLKLLVKKHATDSVAMLKLQLEEEEKIAKHQSEMLKANYKKYEMVENVMQDGTATRLARHYGVYLIED